MFGKNERVIRGHSEREVEIKIKAFIDSRECSYGEEWEAGEIEHRPARLLNYKAWVCQLVRVDVDD